MLALILLLILLFLLFGSGFAWASLHFLIWVAIIVVVLYVVFGYFAGGPRRYWW